MRTITKGELRLRLQDTKPNNDDPKKGFALINVLKPDQYQDNHIPHSLNIPKGDEYEIDLRFDKEKELIVYCMSPRCTASREVAEKLTRKGYSNVTVYEGGMTDWRDGEHMTYQDAPVQPNL